MTRKKWNRREILAGTACSMLPGISLGELQDDMRTARVPSSGELLPVIGLGTYSVFDVASTDAEIASKREIMQLLIDKDASVVDTSPMYDRSERVIGDVIRSGVDRRELFLATKVWTQGKASGVAQIQRSAELLHSDVIDLMQIHNLVDTAVHMPTIREQQQDGRIRYSGLTHYRADALDDLEREMKQYKPQFIQINYSLRERDAEKRILPLAQELGIAVLINRPFQAGRLFRAVAGQRLPDFALDFAASWGQFFLKFIVSHPAVSCAIPATSKPHHLRDNLGAGFGMLPDRALRKRMIDYFAAL